MTSYIFIAGGIGITPFRSIIADLVHKKTKKDIVLFYIVSSETDILFREVFEEAEKIIGLQVVYSTQKKNRFSLALLQHTVEDWKTRTYFISGPQEMVETYRYGLMQAGISEEDMKVDLFTGY